MMKPKTRIDEIEDLIHGFKQARATTEFGILHCITFEDMKPLAQTLYNSEKERVKGIIQLFKRYDFGDKKEEYMTNNVRVCKYIEMWQAIKHLATLYEEGE